MSNYFQTFKECKNDNVVYYRKTRIEEWLALLKSPSTVWNYKWWKCSSFSLAWQKCPILVRTFVHNSILIIGPEFNCTVMDFICPWHWLLIDFNVIQHCIHKFVHVLLALHWDFYRSQTKFAKVMFLHMSVILSTRGGWYPRLPCRWYPSMPCKSPGGCIPACLAGFRAHTQGRAWGVWLGGVSRPTLGGSPGPNLGDLQAHSGGLQAHTWGDVYPRMHWSRPPYSWWLLLRVVHILLEWILVSNCEYCEKFY